MAYPLPLVSFIGFVPLPEPDAAKAITPGRASWRVDGIGRCLKGRPDGVAYLHSFEADASPLLQVVLFSSARYRSNRTVHVVSGSVF